MDKFDDFIEYISSHTNWKNPKINEYNRHYFSIQAKNNDFIDVEFFTPEARTLIMQVHILPLSSDAYQRNEKLKEYAKYQTAACRKRPSILSLEDDNLFLYRHVPMQDFEIMLEQVNHFLKDVDWWLEKNNAVHTTSHASPFSMSSWSK